LKYENEIILLTEDSLSSYFKLIIQFPKDQSYYLPLKDLNVVFWDYRGGRGCDHDVADNKFVKSENLDYIIDTR
jgi:hypothetical protein